MKPYDKDSLTTENGPRCVERLVRQLSAEKIGSLLIEHGIIHPDAIEDPEWYDGWITRQRVEALSQEIAQILRHLPSSVLKNSGSPRNAIDLNAES